jgi:hypothetical protein
MIQTQEVNSIRDQILNRDVLEICVEIDTKNHASEEQYLHTSEPGFHAQPPPVDKASPQLAPPRQPLEAVEERLFSQDPCGRATGCCPRSP